VLVAANKQDVFTALPAAVVKKRLEEEIGAIRASRSKGLLDSGAKGDDAGIEEEEEEEWLGEYGSKAFGFEQVSEFGVEVVVKGGNVIAEGGEEERRVGDWWDWVAENL
jgi:signal recognition particle receptor subunit beta